MPLPFGDGSFDACVSHFLNLKDDEETARKKCGAIQSKLDTATAEILKEYGSTATASYLIEAEKDADALRDRAFIADGRKFARIFLISDSTNINRWQVMTPSIARRIRTFIDRPFVSEPDYKHFGAENMSVQQILTEQEKYRAGTIRDVVVKENNTAYAIVEFEDNALGNKTWEDMQRGEAIYSSPAIAGHYIPVNGVNLYTDWIGLHLARVSEPAYGVFHASIKETCQGDEKKCINALVASASKYIEKEENSSQVQTATSCTKMQTNSAIAMDNFDSMTDEEKKKKMTEMASVINTLHSDLASLKAQVANIPGMDGEKSDEIKSKSEGNDKSTADDERIKKLEAELEKQIETQKSSEIASYIALKSEAGLYKTAQAMEEEKDQLKKKSLEQVQASIAAVTPILEHIINSNMSTGYASTGRQVRMPQVGTASVQGTQKYSSLKDIKRSWA